MSKATFPIHDSELYAQFVCTVSWVLLMSFSGRSPLGEKFTRGYACACCGSVGQFQVALNARELVETEMQEPPSAVAFQALLLTSNFRTEFRGK
jgi:hypothetical protein